VTSDEVLARERFQAAGILAEDGFGQTALALLELEHFLFDGVLGNQPIGEHLARLADAMRAIDRLRFDRRVPPRIEQEDVLGGGEVEAEAARLEADQEQLAVRIGLEAVDARVTVARPAVEVLVGEAEAIERSAHAIEQLHELREDDCLVTLLEHFAEV
jgi:hypothetical protein